MITKFIWNIAQFEVTEMIWCIALGLGAWSEVRVSDRVLGFGFAVDGDMGLWYWALWVFGVGILLYNHRRITLGIQLTICA